METKKKGKSAFSDDSESASVSIRSAPTCLAGTDESSVSELSHSETFTSSSVLPHLKADHFLKKLQHTIQEMSKREEKLNQMILDQKRLAKARYINDNETGALLSIKKVLKLQHERTRIAVAMDKGYDAMMDIEEAISREKSLTMLERGTKNKGKPLWFKVDLGEHASIMEEIQSILCEEPVFDDVELRQALQNL